MAKTRGSPLPVDSGSNAEQALGLSRLRRLIYCRTFGARFPAALSGLH